ncbi:alpha/beta hydrolase [candidate division KSB1 bacterium]|nr:alpha/beta hydrolase [candidate division KSB1 bacterium]
MRMLEYLFLIVLLFAACEQSEMATVFPVPYRYWESNSVQCNGMRIHYWRAGTKGNPVMVLAHGITDYGLNWATLAAKFEKEYDIVMYDARGHGYSQKPDGPYSLETHMEDLVGLIQSLDIKKPILLGHSMGGSVVALTGASYPDLPTAIIMEDPPMGEELEKLTVDIQTDWKAWITKQSTTPKEQLIKLARTEYHLGWPAFEYDHWAEAKLLVVPNVINILEGDGFGNPDEIFPKITAPTLILKADAEEKQRERHLKTAALLPNGKLLHIQGANHLIRNDKPEEMEREIRAFLSSLSL